MNSRHTIKSAFFLLLCQVYSTGFTQQLPNLIITASDTTQTLLDVINRFQKETQVRFYFKSEWLEGMSVSGPLMNGTILQAMDSLFLNSDFNYYQLDENNIVIVKDPAKSLQRKSFLADAMNERKRIETIKIGRKQQARTYQTAKITGAVKNLNNAIPIEGATVSIVGASVGTTTNKFGRFELDLETGFNVLSIRSVGYEELVVDMEIYHDGFVNFELKDEAILLNEVVITNKIADEIVNPQMGLTRVDMEALKQSPSLLGQTDLIKQLQSYSGITSVGPAAAGFNVRGGGADQNLVLYDGMPVFNTAHAFGFFSAFNPDGIREAQLFKSSLSADYGGRVSSVLDIKSKDGSFKKASLSGGIGLVSANLMLDGPIVKEKTSFLISSRFTYSDWLFDAVQSNFVDLSKVNVSFNDWAVKIGHHFNSNTNLTVSGYSSSDKFSLKSDTTYSNKTQLVSIKFDKQITSKLALVTTAGTGRYHYALSSNALLYKLSYDINYHSFDINMRYDLDKHHLSTGVQSLLYEVNPGKLDPLSHKSVFRKIELPITRAIEMAYFLNDEFLLSDKMAINIGLRLPLFANIGPETVNQYQEGIPIAPFTKIDEITYASGKWINTYTGIEPRFSARYSLRESVSMKFSYNRINQFLNLITNTTAITPFDIWQPSNLYFKPQQGDQVALGFYKNLKQAINLSVETYYKYIQNVTDFKDGANLILNKALETDLLQGTSKSYGVEFGLLKNEGRLTGLLNYTYSRSFRQFPVVTGGETINGGRVFASNYDQPNIINANLKYAFSRRYSLATNFTYRDGRPFTVPVSYYEIENIPIVNFANRNEFRMPDYHHLDLAFTIEGNHKRKKSGHGTWTFSIYNIYGRRNPYSIFYKTDETGAIKSYKLSVIGSIIPSVNYSFKI